MLTILKTWSRLNYQCLTSRSHDSTLSFFYFPFFPLYTYDWVVPLRICYMSVFIIVNPSIWYSFNSKSKSKLKLQFNVKGEKDEG